MKVSRALEILKENTLDIDVTNCVLVGLQIITKHEDDPEINFSHDQMMVGNFEQSVSTMTEDEVAKLGRFGWTYDEDHNCWLHF